MEIRVFYHYGTGQPFKGLGVIVRLAGRNAYEVLTDHGYSRIYNQSNLKARFDNAEPDLDAEWEAYEAVHQMETQLIGEKRTFVHQKDMIKI